MARLHKSGSTLKQTAYARRVFGGQGKDRKHIALDVGYSPAVANDVKAKIESKPGFNNAMAKLAADSNLVALQVMHELKARGFSDFSNKDLVAALNAIGGAWGKFNSGLMATEREMNKGKNPGNKLRTIILERVDSNMVRDAEPAHITEVEASFGGHPSDEQKGAEEDLDF